MARFCYCFVIVGQKLFVLKELAFQKAWSQKVNDFHFEKSQKAKNLELDKDNFVSVWWIIQPINQMRSVINASNLKVKLGEVFNYAQFLSKAIVRLSRYVREGLLPKEDVTRAGINHQEPVNFALNLYNIVDQINKIEHFCQQTPSIEWDLNEAMRATYFQQKDNIIKSWTRSNLYTKSKILDQLSTDVKDIELYASLFKNRDFEFD